MSGLFSPRRPSDVADLVRRQVLALVVSHGPDGFLSTPLPLLAETGEDGAVTALIGHFARSNPQAALAEREPRALVQVLGPHAYVPPRWVSRPAWAPTWVYAYAAFEVELDLNPADNDAAIRALSEHLEPDGWRVDALGERYAKLLPHVVAFRARVVKTHARFKLGQDEDQATFGEIVDEADPALAALMKDQRA
ncbi:MAG: FMN-binding negative transcriptional regulator [Caulobacter sp.]